MMSIDAMVCMSMLLSMLVIARLYEAGMRSSAEAWRAGYERDRRLDDVVRQLWTSPGYDCDGAPWHGPGGGTDVDGLVIAGAAYHDDGTGVTFPYVLDPYKVRALSTSAQLDPSGLRRKLGISDSSTSADLWLDCEGAAVTILNDTTPEALERPRYALTRRRKVVLLGPYPGVDEDDLVCTAVARFVAG